MDAQGSPFTSADLIRAGVHVAVSAVIFKQKIDNSGDESLVDADTICIYRYGHVALWASVWQMA